MCFFRFFIFIDCLTRLDLRIFRNDFLNDFSYHPCWITINFNKFNIKDFTKKEHQHDLIYGVKFPPETFDEIFNYVGGRLAERVSDLRGSSHMNKHFIEKTGATVKRQDFEISSKAFRQRKIKKKVSEEFFIKDNKSSLNRQEKDVLLTLFN